MKKIAAMKGDSNVPPQKGLNLNQTANPKAKQAKKIRKSNNTIKSSGSGIRARGDQAMRTTLKWSQEANDFTAISCVAVPAKENEPVLIVWEGTEQEYINHINNVLKEQFKKAIL